MQNTRNERFKRLAVPRTNAVLNKLRILGNLSSKSNYEYSEDQIKKIFSEIESSVREARNRFHFSKEKNFKL